MKDHLNQPHQASRELPAVRAVGARGARRRLVRRWPTVAVHADDLSGAPGTAGARAGDHACRRHRAAADRQPGDQPEVLGADSRVREARPACRSSLNTSFNENEPVVNTPEEGDRVLPAKRHGRAGARAVSRHEILIEGHPESPHTADRGHRQRWTGSIGTCGPTRAKRSPSDAARPEAAGGVLQPLVLSGFRRHRSAADRALRGSRRAVRLRRHRRRRHAAVGGTPHCSRSPGMRRCAARNATAFASSARGARRCPTATFTRTDVELSELFLVGVARVVPARPARRDCRR